MEKSILKVAEDYQKYARQSKELEAKMKPLKEKLVDYGKSHKKDFDESFQIKFENGTYISLRVKPVVDGKKADKLTLAQEYEEFQKLDLDEKACLEAYNGNNRLKKRMDILGLSVAEKESYAVYAG